MEKIEHQPWEQEEEEEVKETEEDVGAAVALLSQQQEEEEAAAVALQGQQSEKEEEEEEEEEEAAAVALQGQQSDEEEQEDAVALQGQQSEKEEEEEEVAAGALQRRPRHLTTATGIGVSDNSNVDVMLPFSTEELRSGNSKDINNDVVEEVDSIEMSAKKSVSYYKDEEGTESVYGFSLTENSGIQGSASEKNPGDDGLVVIVEKFNSQNSQSAVTNYQYKESLKDDSFSGFRHTPSEMSFKEHKTNNYFSDVTVARDDIEHINDSDQELTELDVEGVLEKQNTHDLYCPNCNSCITRRVIVRKRKRKIRISGEDLKHNKLETVVGSEIDAITSDATDVQGLNAVDISSHATNDQGLTPVAGEYNRDREPEIFRCLSCFSFFIPTGNGFKPFKIFGDKSEKENIQSSQQISAIKKNWFSSIFASRKEETLIEPGSGHLADVEENIVGAVKQEVVSPPQSVGTQGLEKSSTAEPQKAGDDIVPSSTQGPELPGKVIADVGEKSDDLMEKSRGSDQLADVEENIVGASQEFMSPPQSSVAQGLVQSSTAEPQEGGDDTADVGAKLDDVIKKGRETAALDHPELVTENQLDLSSFSNVMLSNKEIDHPTTQISGRAPVHTEEPVAIESENADDKDSILLAPKPVSVLEKSDINEKVNVVADLPSEDGQNVGVKLPTGSVGEDKNVAVELSDADYSSEVSQYVVISTKVDIRMGEPLKADSDAYSKSIQDSLLLQDGQSITKDLKDMPAKSSAGSDTIIIVKERGPVEPAASQEAAQDIITSAETGISPRTEISEARGFQGLDIIKSVVYGGLIESVTSVGVVSSAAGADATTLNILALGLANLIGGLFMIGHNLWELKNENYGSASNQVTEGVSDQVTQQLDRYQELLGRRENFWLHATVSVLSFLVFGLLPPVIYAFSFRKSDNRDFKLIAVAVASLLCIVVLATGKAYFQKPPKAYIKTVTYYVVMVFMASGVSYAVGDLIKILLEKLGWFDSDLLLTLPVLETTPMQPAWGSY